MGAPGTARAPRRSAEAPSWLVDAGRALAGGLEDNAGGHPRRASAQFRAALAHLGAGGTPPDVGVPFEAECARIRARAQLGLVMSDFELRADVDASLAVLDDAEHHAGVAGSPATRVAVLGQRGLLWQRAGDLGRALQEHDRAAAALADAEPVDACCILLNRGTLHLDLGHVPEARRDLTACAENAAAIGNEALVFKARHNLGYVEFLAGDLPRALAVMAEAAKSTGEVSPAVALLDRAQVLLEAGLVTEADTTLGRAAGLFAEQRLTLDLAQVELARSQCALLLKRPGAALAQAQAARRRLARRGNAPWLARADLMVLRAQLDVLLDAEPVDRRRLALLAARARTVADTLASADGDRDLVRAARLIRAAALASTGRLEEGAGALADAGRLTGREPLSLALAHRGVAARLDFGAGRVARGRRHVVAGQALLAEHRRQLGSVEAVTAAAVHGQRLMETELIAALRAEDATWVLEAVERGRATFAGAARVRPPDDPELAEMLAELRVAVERERLLPLEPGSTSERATFLRDAAHLRSAARERAWQIGGGQAPPSAVRAADALATLRAEAGGPCVADYLVFRGVVHAVVVDRHGARLLRLAAAAEVEATARRVDVDLHALSGAMLPEAIRTVVRSSLDRGLAWLDERLVRPLGAEAGLHVVTGGVLTTLPWSILPSRAGRPTSVGARLVLDQGRPRRPGIAAVAGPGLRHAGVEVAAVAAVWPGAEVLVGPDASCADTAAAIRSAGVVHLATHGHHEADNPMFSWLRMADGPLFAHELEGSDLGGSLVVLSACELGRATVRPGGEVLGLASALLRLGSAGVVASLAPLRDDVAAAVMPVLHSRVAAGVAPVEALADACSGLGEPVPLAFFSTAVPGLLTPAGS